MEQSSMGRERAQRVFRPRHRRHDGYEMHFIDRFTHHQCPDGRGDCGAPSDVLKRVTPYTVGAYAYPN
jgi:hypothetical protein